MKKRIILVVRECDVPTEQQGWEMLEQTPRREAGTTWAIPIVENRDRRRMLLALVLLLVSLVVVLVNNREIWFAADDTPAADDTSPVWTPNRVVQPPSVPTAQAKIRTVAKVAKPANTE